MDALSISQNPQTPLFSSLNVDNYIHIKHYTKYTKLYLGMINKCVEHLKNHQNSSSFTTIFSPFAYKAFKAINSSFDPKNLPTSKSPSPLLSSNISSTNTSNFESNTTQKKRQIVICYQQGEKHSIEKQNTNRLNYNLLQLTSLSKNTHDQLAAIRFKDIQKEKLSKRCRIFNNDFFSHISGLNYCSFSTSSNLDQEDILFRLINLSTQIKFAVKYRSLTFRHCLLAYADKKLIVCKDKTVTQGSYYTSKKTPHRRSRSTDGIDINKTPKYFEECHISCIPNIYDNSSFKTSIEKKLQSFENSINLTNFSIDKFIETEFQENNRKIALRLLFKLYKVTLKNPVVDFNDRDIKSKYIPINSTKLYARSNLLLKLVDYSKKNNSFDKEDKKLINKVIKELSDKEQAKADISLLKKNISSGTNLDQIKKLNSKVQKCDKNIENLNSDLKLLLIRNFEELENFLIQHLDKDFHVLQLFYHWITSHKLPKERIKDLLATFNSSESIIPLNSILGMMLSATVTMPSEINHGIDVATDKTHHIVAKLLTEFSNISNPTSQDFDNYIDKYADILKNSYNNYISKNICNINFKEFNDAINTALKNIKKTVEESLKTIQQTVNNFPNSQESLESTLLTFQNAIYALEGVIKTASTIESFIKKNEGSIAEHYLKHITDSNAKYDEEFEKLVMGEVINDPLLITKPALIFQKCKKCWK